MDSSQPEAAPSCTPPGSAATPIDGRAWPRRTRFALARAKKKRVSKSEIRGPADSQGRSVQHSQRNSGRVTRRPPARLPGPMSDKKPAAAKPVGKESKDAKRKRVACEIDDLFAALPKVRAAYSHSSVVGHLSNGAHRGGAEMS